MKLDFCIIGAAKSGTTALFDSLCQHPQVFEPDRKELNYWAYDQERPGLLAWGAQPARDWPATTFAEYARHFAAAPPDALLGEASVVYLESHFAPEALAAHNEDVRLIAVLRDPVERAWSGYWMARRNGWTTDSPEEAFDLDANRVHSGRYGYLLGRYFDRFAADRIFVEDYARLGHDPHGLLADLFGFLGLRPHADAAIERVNTGGTPRSQRMHRMLHSSLAVRTGKLVRGTPVYAAADRLRRSNLQPVPDMDPAMVKRLREFYAPDIAELERLTDRDFSHWSSPAGERP